MARTTLTTTEAATMLGVDPRSFARWAYHHGVRPLHRVRVGRSTVTAWSMVDLANATAPAREESGVMGIEAYPLHPHWVGDHSTCRPGLEACVDQDALIAKRYGERGRAGRPVSPWGVAEFGPLPHQGQGVYDPPGSNQPGR